MTYYNRITRPCESSRLRNKSSNFTLINLDVLVVSLGQLLIWFYFHWYVVHVRPRVCTMACISALLEWLKLLQKKSILWFVSRIIIFSHIKLMTNMTHHHKEKIYMIQLDHYWIVLIGIYKTMISLFPLIARCKTISINFLEYRSVKQKLY